MPCFCAAFCSSTAPFITPWSVSASAGCPNSAALAASASILHAPSRSEYSEWTWRCAQQEELTGSSHCMPRRGRFLGARFRVSRTERDLVEREPAGPVEPAVQDDDSPLV